MLAQSEYSETQTWFPEANQSSKPVLNPLTANKNQRDKTWQRFITKGYHWWNARMCILQQKQHNPTFFLWPRQEARRVKPTANRQPHPNPKRRKQPVLKHKPTGTPLCMPTWSLLSINLTLLWPRPSPKKSTNRLVLLPLYLLPFTMTARVPIWTLPAMTSTTMTSSIWHQKRRVSGLTLCSNPCWIDCALTTWMQSLQWVNDDIKKKSYYGMFVCSQN